MIPEPVPPRGKPQNECRFYLPMWLEREAQKEANRRRARGAVHPETSKSAVYRDAVRFFLAGRVPGASIGEQLREARTDAGLSLPEVSRRAGETGKPLAPSVISRIETQAERSPRLSTLQALAKALDVSVVIDPDGVAVLRRQA